MPVLKIEALHRTYFTGNRSFVTVVWKDDPEKRLGLPVSFNCQLDNLKMETESAVKALAKELHFGNGRGPLRPHRLCQLLGCQAPPRSE